MVVFIIAGLVCTSRLIVSDHTPFEIYTGILIGIIAQFIANIFIG
jgi:acid phosphatase family membrane protein YuiD